LEWIFAGCLIDESATHRFKGLALLLDERGKRRFAAEAMERVATG